MMFRKILSVSALVSTMAILPTSAQAATDTATVGAVVLTPITITKNVDMDFGNMYPTAVAGTVVLSTAGGLTHTNVTAGPVGGAAAQFTVTGTAGANYAITLPAGNIQLDAGAENMQVNGFGHDQGVTPAVGGAGSSTVLVGATLNVGVNQAAGSYSGSFDVTVEYN